MGKLSFQSALNDIISIHSTIEDRSDMLGFRKSSLEKLITPIVKNAFDTRRINQYTDFNPRRNLQYYHSSEPFITKDASQTIKTFFKLKTAVDSIKEDFNGDPDYLDSYCRILSAALDRTLRMEQRDMDFAQPQFDYLNELLYLRYRLKDEDINKLNEKELRNIILDKDEKLLHKNIYAQYSLNKEIIKTNNVSSNDTLADKLFAGVKASSENKEVERTITIKINDQIKEDIKKEG
jgi:hypothetical protein